MTNDKDPEELLAQSKEQKRHTSEPTTTDEEPADLEAEIAAVYKALDAGDVPSNLTMRDENLAALIRGLDNAGQLETVGAALREHLDRQQTDSESLGSIAGLAVRVGLREVRPELEETAKEAKRNYIKNQETEF